MTRKVVCILGMHRSGTSVVARFCNALGVDLGPSETLMRPKPDNPRGHWENADITSLNDRILEHFHGSWHVPPVFPPGWEDSDDLADLREEAHALIDRFFRGSRLWGWKDPRNCLTLRFWARVVPETRYVVVFRSPVDVAKSLRQRNEFSSETCYALWMRYTTSALAQTSGKRRILIWYDDVLSDPTGEMRRLARFMDLTDPEQFASAEKAADGFLEEGLRHHSGSIADVLNSTSLPFPHKALYTAVRLCVPNRGVAPGAAASSEQVIVELLSDQALRAGRDLAGSERAWVQSAFAARKDALHALEREHQAVREEAGQVRTRMVFVEQSFHTLEKNAAKERQDIREEAEQVRTRMVFVEQAFHTLEKDAAKERSRLVEHLQIEREAFHAAQEKAMRIERDTLGKRAEVLRAEREESRLLATRRETAIERLTAQQGALRNEVAEQQERIHRLEEHSTGVERRLAEREQALAAIKASSGYVLVERLRRAVRFVAPEGTRRAALLRKVLSMFGALGGSSA